MKVCIHKGKPNKKQQQQILKLIKKGFKAGINNPNGINWHKSNLKKKLKRENVVSG